jgi:hypothetical protein
MVVAGVTRPRATGAQGDGETEIDMDPVVIKEGSEAFDYLRRVVALPEIYKISLDLRGDGVAIKANEYA